MARVGACEYCGVLLMEEDRYCVGCGAPAIGEPSSIDDKYFTDGGVMPVSLWADLPPPPEPSRVPC